MFAKMKNIIIFVAIGIVLIILYVYFFKGSPDEETLVSSSDSSGLVDTGGEGVPTTSLGADFLGLLLNIKHIKLNDSIFADPAFISLHDSSIILTQDGTEGRPNPFAPIGSDEVFTAPPETSTLESFGGGTSN